MTNETVSENVKSKYQWVRLLYMILFVIIFEVTAFVALWIVIFQFISALFTGKPMARLQEVGHSVGVFMQQIVWFLTYNSDEKPFPFGDWPPAKKTTTKRVTKKTNTPSDAAD